MPLYQLMKKSESEHFTWTPQADSAFHELMKMLSTALILASPLPKEPMLLYIAATNRVVNAVVVVEQDEGSDKVQRPVVLPERSAFLVEAELPPLPEDGVRRVHGGEEAEIGRASCRERV